MSCLLLVPSASFSQVFINKRTVRNTSGVFVPFIMTERPHQSDLSGFIFSTCDKHGLSENEHSCRRSASFVWRSPNQRPANGSIFYLSLHAASVRRRHRHIRSPPLTPGGFITHCIRQKRFSLTLPQLTNNASSTLRFSHQAPTHRGLRRRQVVSVTEVLRRCLDPFIHHHNRYRLQDTHH